MVNICRDILYVVYQCVPGIWGHPIKINCSAYFRPHQSRYGQGLWCRLELN